MEKSEVLKEVLSFLKSCPHTQMEFVQQHIREVLEARGECGARVTGNQYHQTHMYVPVPQQARLLVNEVIWDLIIQRIVTPGAMGGEEWPWLRVTDMEKLEAKLKELE